MITRLYAFVLDYRQCDYDIFDNISISINAKKESDYNTYDNKVINFGIIRSVMWL